MGNVGGHRGQWGTLGGHWGQWGRWEQWGHWGGSHPHQRGSLGGEGGQKPLPLPILGPLGSALSTRYGARPVVMAGGFLAGMGFLLGAFATRLSHLYLSVGLLAGMLDDLERGVPWVRGGRY